MRSLLLVVSLVLVAVPGAFARDVSTTVTLEQQVGQLVVMSFRGTTAPAYVLQALHEKRAAGVILFGGNIASPDRLRALSGSCLLYTSPSPRDRQKSRMPSSA